MKISDGFIVEQTRSEREFKENINKIRYKLYKELRNMGNVLGLCVAEYPLKNIYAEVESRLSEISGLYQRKSIDPYLRINCSLLDKNRTSEMSGIRVGVFPVDADPLHWGHILIGLSAMARMSLDKVVYLISGAKAKKSEMVLPVVRHVMGRSVLKMFSPLFECSDIALGYDFDDTTNFFRFLDLNREQKMEAVYISGLDHLAEESQHGRVDTNSNVPAPENMKERMENETLHNIETAIVPRQSQPFAVNKYRNIVVLPEVPFEVSSSMIRQALQEGEVDDAISFLPYPAYVDVRAFGLYGEKQCAVSAASMMSTEKTTVAEMI